MTKHTSGPWQQFYTSNSCRDIYSEKGVHVCRVGSQIHSPKDFSEVASNAILLKEAWRLPGLIRELLEYKISAYNDMCYHKPSQEVLDIANVEISELEVLLMELEGL